MVISLYPLLFFIWVRIAVRGRRRNLAQGAGSAKTGTDPKSFQGKVPQLPKQLTTKNIEFFQESRISFNYGNSENMNSSVACNDHILKLDDTPER